MLLTQKAIKAIRARTSPGEYCLISVKGGGCGGVQLGIEIVNTRDTYELNSQESTVVSDPESITILTGATIDYETTPWSSGFVVTPPPGSVKCGCGESFTLAK